MRKASLLNSSVEPLEPIEEVEVSQLRTTEVINNIATQTAWATIGFIAEEIMKIIPVVFIATHSDLDHLAALGIGNALLLIVIQAFSYGFASGLQTLVQHCYGNEQYYQAGANLNRALVVNS
jgi:Na+-driven multidrug efflux pump